MSFKSNVSAPNFEQMALQKLQLALQMRAQKQRDQALQEQTRIDKIAAINKAKSDAFDLRKKEFDFEKERFEFAGQADAAGEGIASARSLADKLPTPSSLVIPGSPQDTNAFANIVQEYDPQGVQKGIGAEQAFTDRVNTAARARRVVSGTSRQEAINSALGSADVAMEEKRLKKAEEREKAREDVVQKEMGKLDAVGGLVKTIRKTKRDARNAQRNGDTELAQDLFRMAEVYDGMLEVDRTGGPLLPDAVLPSTPGDIFKASMMLGTSKHFMKMASDFQDDIMSGDVKVGIAGKVAKFGHKAAAFLTQALDENPQIGPEMQGIMVDMLDKARKINRQGEWQSDEGKQLALELMEMSMSYGFVLGNRDSARFTLLEYQNTKRNFNTTGALTSIPQMLKAIDMVYTLNARKEARLTWWMKKVGADPAGLDNNLLPGRQNRRDEVQQWTDQFESRGVDSGAVNGGGGVGGGGGGGGQSIDPNYGIDMNAASDAILQQRQQRRQQNAR